MALVIVNMAVKWCVKMTALVVYNSVGVGGIWHVVCCVVGCAGDVCCGGGQPCQLCRCIVTALEKHEPRLATNLCQTHILSLYRGYRWLLRSDRSFS